MFFNHTLEQKLLTPNLAKIPFAAAARLVLSG
jgi:hypothetical protein